MRWVEPKELASNRASIRRRVDVGGAPSSSPMHDDRPLPGLAQRNECPSFASQLPALGGERRSNSAQWSSNEAFLLASSSHLKDRWRTKQVNSFTRDGRVAPSFSHLSAFGLKVVL